MEKNIPQDSFYSKVFSCECDLYPKEMILIIQNILPHYRRGIYNALSANDDIVVVHSGASNKQAGDKFREVILPMKRFGPFYVQKGLSRIIELERPSRIIAMFDIRWINSLLAMYHFDKKLTWIWWGLDEGANVFARRLKCFLARRNNAIVFYSDSLRNKFIQHGLDEFKLFVANNTVKVEHSIPCFDNTIKNTFINVGTLDTRKQNDVLISAFKYISTCTTGDIKLVLIGEGKDRKRLEKLIVDKGLIGKVFLTGHIEDPVVLASYYKVAIASISFGQAGLAVLQSMAFGVPFVTKRNAISGGEIFNIKHDENGVLCDDSEVALAAIMKRMVDSPGYSRQLGRNAYKYYVNNSSVENMLRGFMAAFDYSNKRNETLGRS